MNAQIDFAVDICYRINDKVEKLSESIDRIEKHLNEMSKILDKIEESLKNDD